MSQPTSDAMLIKGSRVIDPGQKLDGLTDILIQDGKIAAVGGVSDGVPEGCQVIDAGGLTACPGFVDLHCHLREPGFEYKETIATGTQAAARGGFTTICCMPNTEPPIDNAAVVDFVLQRARSEGSGKGSTHRLCKQGPKG